MSTSLAFDRRPQSQFAALLSNGAVQDGLFAGMIVLARVPAGIGAPGATLCLAMTALYALARPGQLVDVGRNGWIQLAFPALSLLSIAWAEYGDVTQRAALQMSLTAISGLLLSQSRHPRAVLAGLFVAFGGYTIASLALGHTRHIGLTHEVALMGIGGEDKNFFANTASTALLLCVAMLALCIERGWPGRTLATAVVTLACGAASYLAKSAGSLAATGAAGAVLLTLLALRRRDPAIKVMFVAALVLAAVLSLLFFEPLLALIQQLSNKDAGLTGRGYLWYRADFFIAARPWLGLGYCGFWTPANPDAVGLWHYFDVRQQGTAFSFHNTYVQTLVELGYLGLAVLLASWLTGLALLLRRFVLTQSLAACFWIGYLVLEIAKSPAEPIRPSPLTAPTILMFLALGFSCLPVTHQVREKRRQDKGATSPLLT